MMGAIWFGMPLQYGGQDCSHSEIHFGGRFIFGTEQIKLLKELSFESV